MINFDENVIKNLEEMLNKSEERIKKVIEKVENVKVICVWISLN